MSRPNSAQHITKIAGSLCLDPTDLSISFPHGGIALGAVRERAVRKSTEPYVVRAEEFGGAPTEIIADMETPIFVGIMATWDEQVVSRLLGGSLGTVTSRGALARTVNSQRAGTVLTGNVLYMSPRDDDDPGVIFYNAVPIERLDGESSFTAQKEYGKPLAWYGLPDQQYRVWFEGLRQDIVL